MAVLEIGSPSGFMADIGSVVSSAEKPKRVEQEDKKIVLYYDEVRYLYSHANCVCVGMVYCFNVVRPCVRPAVCPFVTLWS